jgi:hypothetical protein
MVENLQHLLVASKPRVAVRICVEGALLGDLLKHGHEQHIDTRVRVNKVLELLQGWM